MSYYDDSSLFVAPNGYKASVLFAQKPMDANGQLAFTRSNDTATRVASNGLIERVRTNLLLQSETFSNATWGKANTTFSVDTLTANAGTSLKTLNQAQTQQGLQTIYFDVAYVSHSFFQILFGTGATDNQYANFDIQNKVLGTTGGGTIRSSIQDFGTYVRIAIVVSTSAKTNVNLAFVDSASALRAASSTSTGSVKVFRSQLETGDIATDYIATTTAAVSVGPVANVARLDYLNSSCPKLNLEPQRTNLLQFSEQFDNAYWTKDASTATANFAISPDGYTNADKLFETATTDFHRVYGPTISVTSGTTYTASIFVKAAEVTTFAIELRLTSNVADATFDLVAGTASSGGVIQDYGNGWYRCIVTGTATATGGGRPMFFIKQRSSYAGNASNGLLVYGAQFEAGAYATSYIPTLAASVTRGADSCSKTGISSLIGQTEGTLFVEFQINANNTDLLNRIFSVSDGTLTSRVLIIANTDETFRFVVSVASTTVVNITTSASVLGGRHKVAFAYKANDFIAYVDGVQVGSNTAVSSVPASLTTAYVGTVEGGASAQVLEGTVSQAILFKTRLPNSELASLTTL